MVFPARKRQEHPGEQPDGHPQIPVTNESFAHMWTDYYSLVAQSFKEAVTGVSGPRFSGVATDLLARSSQESSLYLLWDYVNSPVWKRDIIPGLQDPEDTIRVLLRFLASMNWEKARLCSLIPKQELIIEVESELADSPEPGMACHMTAGSAAAIMDLLYGEGKSPEKKMFSFRCVETECRSKGAPACRFVVQPTPKHPNGQFIKLDFNNR